MSDSLVDSHAQALSHLEKAENYKKMGLSAQVQYELTEAERLDPDIARHPRFTVLRSGVTQQIQQVAALEVPRRIGATMLFTDVVLGVLILWAVGSAGYAVTAPQSFIFAVIINVIIGINLWRGKEGWQRYTVWWAVFAAVVFGGLALADNRPVDLVTQLAFSGSLILLLKDTPSRERVIASIAIFGLGYVAVTIGQVVIALSS